MQSPIKRLVKRYFSWQKTNILEKLALDMAHQSRIILSQQIVKNAKTLPPEQVPGYVRAYTACRLEFIVESRSDL
jgi:hypothetical protein